MRGVDEVFLRGDRDESNRLRVSSEIKSNGITAVTAKTAKRILLITTPLAFGLPSSAKIIMRYAVLVTGPAGAGKSTFCASIMTHLIASKRTGHLVNLDPAAAPDSFEYAPSIDIKDLISVEDAMSELGYGPNGGLVYCFEYVSAPFARPELLRPSVFFGSADTSCRIWTGSRRKSVNTMTTTLSLTAPVRLMFSHFERVFFFFLPCRSMPDSNNDADRLTDGLHVFLQAR